MRAGIRQSHDVMSDLPRPRCRHVPVHCSAPSEVRQGIGRGHGVCRTRWRGYGARRSLGDDQPGRCKDGRHDHAGAVPRKSADAVLFGDFRCRPPIPRAHPNHGRCQCDCLGRAQTVTSTGGHESGKMNVIFEPGADLLEHKLDLGRLQITAVDLLSRVTVGSQGEGAKARPPAPPAHRAPPMQRPTVRPREDPRCHC